MTNFSPSAQAIWTAFHQSKCEISPNYAKCLANAIRVAADQVVPEPSDAAKALFPLATVQVLLVIRDEFHAIATELEGQ